jgi:hypothetical protein
MLQLLLERRQSYEDIGSLLGLTTEEVRARARAALTEIAGEDPDAQVGLTDYLLGQADPIGRADAARHLQNDEAAHNLARKLVSQLQVLAPDAQLPDLPASRGRRKGPEPEPRPEPELDVAPPGGKGPGGEAATPAAARGRFAGLRDRQMQVIVALIAATVLVVAVVLAVSGVFDSGSSDSSASKSPANTDEVPLKLTAPKGGTAKGAAVFSNTGGQTQQIALRIAATGLKPSPKDQSQTYTIWLYVDPKNAYPLAPATVGADGKLTATRPLPALFTATQAGLQVLARFRSVRVSLTPTRELAAVIAAAVKNQEPLVPYLGTTILQGQIPGSVGGATGATGTTTQPQQGGTPTQP